LVIDKKEFKLDADVKKIVVTVMATEAGG